MNEYTLVKWNFFPLGKLFKILRGSITPKNNPIEKLEYYSIPVFDNTGSYEVVYGGEIESNKTLITEPAILVSKLNPRKPRVQIVKKEKEIRQCASTEFMAYSAKDSNIVLEFYKHLFLSDSFTGKLQLVATGSTNSHVRVTPSETLEWEVPFPPFQEQQKIATILSSVDDVIEKTRAQIDKLKDLKTGMMQELLTKGIGHTEFKDSPVGRIPASWEVRALNELVTIKHGYAFDGEYFRSSPTEYILLTPGNFNRDGRLYFGPKTKYYEGPVPEGFILKNGDVLVVMTDLTKEMTILGNTIILKSPKIVLHNQRIGKVVIHDQVLSPEYLCIVMNSDQLKRHIKDTATGTTVRHTSPTKILEPLVAVPPINEQVKIIKIFQAFNDRLTIVESKLAANIKIKKALMQDLLTGKVRVIVENHQEERMAV